MIALLREADRTWMAAAACRGADLDLLRRVRARQKRRAGRG